MATLKMRLEALEARTPTGPANFCLVLHNREDCQKARDEAIAKFIKNNGCAPVNFINIVPMSANPADKGCQCKTCTQPFDVSGPGTASLMADLIKQADGTALPVVRDIVQ